MDNREQKRVDLALKIIRLEKSYTKNEAEIIRLKAKLDRMWD